MQDDDESSSETQSLRVDRWLWFARFFKSRSQATAAVAGGLVHVNDERIKPSRSIQINDRLTITRDETRFVVIVKSLPNRRGPATEAREAYEETPESIAVRETRRQQARLAPPAPEGRPDKHARKMLRDLRRQ
ncbi:MAG TPA: S4 domain-containing protein [Steroidobacteraceae bacterium]|nr:S4 domain-containing protein [Steroidobacteraceae bacterium]